MLKRIHFPNRSLDLIIELMRTDTLQDAIITISQDDIPLCIELQDEMICIGFRAESEYHHPLHSHLPDTFESFGAEKFTEFHGEPRWQLLLLHFFIDGVEAYSVFDQDEGLVFGFGQFQDIGGWVKVIDIGSPI